jgi:hypothetical protein
MPARVEAGRLSGLDLCHGQEVLIEVSTGELDVDQSLDCWYGNANVRHTRGSTGTGNSGIWGVRERCNVRQ